MSCAATVTGCSTPAEKVQDAQDNVDQANKGLDAANQEYLADLDKYRKQTADKIEVNEQRIAEFKARMATDKREDNEDNRKKLASLEQRNTELKIKMADYRPDGKEKWETFKTDFNRSMDDLGNSFKDLADNKK